MFSLEKNYSKEQKILIQYLKMELEARNKELKKKSQQKNGDEIKVAEERENQEASFTQVDEIFEDKGDDSSTFEDTEDVPLNQVDELFEDEAAPASVVEEVKEAPVSQIDELLEDKVDGTSILEEVEEVEEAQLDDLLEGKADLAAVTEDTMELIPEELDELLEGEEDVTMVTEEAEEAKASQVDEVLTDTKDMTSVADDSTDVIPGDIDDLFADQAEPDSNSEDLSAADLKKEPAAPADEISELANQESVQKPQYDQSIQAIIDTYIPKNILANLNEMNLEHVYRGKRKFVTLMRMKVDQVNLLSQHLSPESYVKLYNKTFNHIFSLIYRHEGIVNQFTGENLLGVFGLFDTDDAANAAKVIDCIKDLSRRIRVINDYLNEKGLSEINIGIGVHSGEVIIGSLGQLGAKDFHIFGDEVKICDFVENLSKKYHFQAVFSEKTMTLLRDDYSFKELDLLSIPGIKEESKVFLRT